MTGSFLSNSTETRLYDCNIKDDFLTCKILRFKRENLDFLMKTSVSPFLSLLSIISNDQTD